MADLAAELEVPPSAVLDQCQRFGIDATWAGAELSAADCVMLRTELGSSAVDGDAAEGEAAEGEAGEPAGSSPEPTSEAPPVPTEPEPTEPVPAAAPLPPTAVGSMPELIDEVTPEPEPEPVSGPPGRVARPGPLQTHAGEASGEAPKPATVTGKRFDRAARNGVLWLVAAVAAFALGNLLENAFALLAVWLFVVVALGFAIFDANRGRRHASLHPDRVRGRWVSVAVLVVAVVAVAGMVLATFVVVRDDSAADAPLGAGDLASVQTMRWGYQRLTTVADHGWKSPAKPEGSCWMPGDADDPRAPERVEVGYDKEPCGDAHTVEIIRVFALTPEADVPYPGTTGFIEAAQERCAEYLADLQAITPLEGTLLVEYPTEEGWDGGDHDVACGIQSEDYMTQSILE